MEEKPIPKERGNASIQKKEKLQLFLNETSNFSYWKESYKTYIEKKL